MDLTRLAEANEFSAVWFAENPFERGALPAAAAAAAATDRIGIGIGVFNPYNRHPSLIAMELGALDQLARGRAMLGIGSGIATAVEQMGFDARHPLSALADAIHIIRLLLRGEKVTHAGRVFSVNSIKLDFLPLRTEMPILMAARGEQSLRLCGRAADGLMLSNMCPAAFTARAVELVRCGALDAGRVGPASVIQYIPCVVRRDRTEARHVVKVSLAPMLLSFWALGQRVPAAKAALVASGIPEEEIGMTVARLRAGAPASEALDDRFVDAFAIAGTAEDCLAQAAAYGTAGVSELALTFVAPEPADDIAWLGEALRSTR